MKDEEKQRKLERNMAGRRSHSDDSRESNKHEINAALNESVVTDGQLRNVEEKTQDNKPNESGGAGENILEELK